MYRPSASTSRPSTAKDMSSGSCVVEVPDVMPVASTVTVAGSSAVPPGPSPAGPSPAAPPLTFPHRKSLIVVDVVNGCSSL